MIVFRKSQSNGIKNTFTLKCMWIHLSRILRILGSHTCKWYNKNFPDDRNICASKIHNLEIYFQVIEQFHMALSSEPMLVLYKHIMHFSEILDGSIYFTHKVPTIFLTSCVLYIFVRTLTYQSSFKSYINNFIVYISYPVIEKDSKIS